MEKSADLSAVLAHAGDRVVGETLAALGRRDEAQRNAPTPEERRHDVQRLFDLVHECVRAGEAGPIIMPSQELAADRFTAGIDLAEVQAAFAVLEEVFWGHLSGAVPDEQRLAALRLVSTILGAGRDALARTYVSLARQAAHPTHGALGQPVPPGPAHGETAPASAIGLGGAADARAASGDTIVRTAQVGQVGVITLNDLKRRNAISARMANGMVAALGTLRAQSVRTVVIRAAEGMPVWSAGHDIDELPRGHRDPLGYDDPLEGLLRAIRTFPAPVLAMVHGTVWGGALDLVLSCDLVTADETASFAITPANLGLPYNTTGLLHFAGRLPVNLIKEMFFTAAPLGAEKAREWMVINHLVPAGELEAVTFELAETMAAKSPMAMAVIKEQLRVLTDYQPIAAQVYERLQGLRRQAYDSSDYLEGLRAFAEKRKPVFRGT